MMDHLGGFCGLAKAAREMIYHEQTAIVNSLALIQSSSYVSQ